MWLTLFWIIRLFESQVPGSITPDLDETCLTADIAWNLTTWRDRLRGSSVTTCDTTLVGDGRCDLTNNMNFNGCSFDGGDCCMSSCLQNCMAKQQKSDILVQDFPYYNPRGIAGECVYKCGSATGSIVNCPYLCLDDAYLDKGITYTSWCQHDRGVKMPMSECFSTKPDVAIALRQCIMDERSHGNSMTASFRCANQSEQCTVQDVREKDGCELHPNQCTKQPCCTKAITAGWIDPTVKILPSLCEIIKKCEASPDCFPTMAACLRENKACQGGCCKCNSLEWYGYNCDQPLCWSKCRHGTCVAPNMCHCDEGWTGPSCETAVCSKPCVAGQGVCVAPERCECLYGWTGTQCETAVSYPPCVNGEAIAPDVCKCEPGWGGRVCDYPICQAYPFPSSDCGHGICESPFKCKCEPGWSALVTVDAQGKDELPFWWKGRNASAAIAPSDFVYGDTRFEQYSETNYVSAQYNAFQCLLPDCRLITDAHCLECQPITAECTKCDPGFFLATDATSNDVVEAGRCARCHLQWPHCRLCSGDRCLDCDPLFVMKNGTCVSDGIFEFSSSVYHADVNSGFVEVKVVRSQASILERSRPIAVRLQTIEDSAISSRSGQNLADYASTSGLLVFGTPDELEKTMRIPIFDNGRFDSSVKSFRVKLLIEPETVKGTTDPIVPLYKAATPSDEAIAASVDSECRVFIWDSDFLSMETVLVESPPSVRVGTSHRVTAHGVKCVQSDILTGSCTETGDMSTTDDFRLIVTTQPTVDTGSNVLLGDAILSGPSEGRGIFESFSSAFVPGSFWINIQYSLPGALGEYYDFNPRPLPGQLSDFRRVDKFIGYRYEKAQQAPAFVRWETFLHFAHLDVIPTHLAFAISPDARLKVFFKNAGQVVNARRSADPSLAGDVFEPVDLSTINAHSVVDICSTEVKLGLYCVDVRPTGSDTQMAVTTAIKQNRVLPDGRTTPYLHALRVELGRTSSYLENPAFMDLLMYAPGSGWAPLPQSCLMTGLHVEGSPNMGYTAVAGDPVAGMSLVEGIQGERVIPVLAGDSFQVRVTLMDFQGNIILDGSYTDRIIIEVVLVDSTLVAQGITWNGRYFIGSLSIPAGSPQYDTTLTASFDGFNMNGSPLVVRVKAATSDPLKSVLSGNYSVLEVDVKRCVTITSYDSGGSKRLDGGDLYEVFLSGPSQAPKPTVPFIPVDNGDATYTLCLQLLTGGDYSLSISLSGVAIPGSPFASSVSGIVAAGESVVTGLVPFSKQPVQAGLPASFTILAKDKYGQTYYDAPSLDVNVTFSPKLRLTDMVTTSASTQGTIEVDFFVCQAVSTYISVTVAGEPVKSSPFLVEVVPSESVAAASFLSFSENRTNIVGVHTSARLDLRDSCGNAATDGLFKSDISLRVRYLGASGGVTAIQAPSLFSKTPSSWTIGFVPQRTGRHVLECYIGNSPCQGAPLYFNSSQLDAAGGRWVLDERHFDLDLVGLGNTSGTSSGAFAIIFADDEFEVELVPRDSRNDEILSFTDTSFVTLGLWKSGQCPAEVVCQSFGRSHACSQFAGCEFDEQNSLCRPRTAECPAGPVPMYSDELQYFYRIQEAGKYLGRFIVDRPGAFHVQVVGGPTFGFGSIACEDRLRAPFDWTAARLSETCFGEAVRTRTFSMRLIGRIRGGIDGLHKISLQTPCEDISVFVDGDEVSSEFDKSDNFFLFESMLWTRQSSHIRFDLSCSSTTMKTDFYMRLLWLPPAAVGYYLIPASAVFYAEPAQPDFEFVRVVNPLNQAEGVAWLDSNVIEVTAGTTFSVSYVGLDVFQNLMEMQDPGASFSVYFDPAIPRQQWSVVANLDGTFTLTVTTTIVADYSAEIVLDNTGFRISREFLVRPSEPLASLSEVVCDPEAPDAGMLVSCVLQLVDASGNIIGSVLGGDYKLEVIMPNSSVIPLSFSTEIIANQAGTYTVLARQLPDNTVFTYKVFTVSPGVTDPCCVGLSDIVVDNVTKAATFEIFARDKFNNTRTEGGNLWRVIFDGPSQFGQLAARVSDPDTGVFHVSASLPELKSTWSVRVELASEKSDNSGTFCPELPLSNTYVKNLTDQRRIGSVATLACDPGYDYSTGVTRLVCTALGGWEGGRPLACRVKYGYCPNLPVMVGVEVISTSMTRRVLEALQFKCLPGYERLMGDNEIFCGYDRKYRRVEDSAVSDFLQCIRVANFCPDLSGTLDASFISGMTTGTNVIGTRLDMRCDEGYERQSGNTTLICNSGGNWASTASSSNGSRLLGYPLTCSKRIGFCAAPEVGGLVVASGYVNSAGIINSAVTFACALGTQVSRGHVKAVCGAGGMWLDELYLHKADFLQCDYLSGVCIDFVDDSNPTRKIVTLTRGTTRDSEVVLECAQGFHPTAGAIAASCLVSAGRWTALDGPTDLLQCAETASYCNSLSVANGTVSLSNTVRALGTVATITCDPGYTFGPATAQLRGVTLVCGFSGWWSELDFTTQVSLTDVACRPIHGHCGELTIDSSARLARLSDDLNTASVASLECLPGYQKISGSELLVCDGVTAAWVGVIEPTQLTCSVIAAFCPQFTVYTDINGTLVEASPVAYRTSTATRSVGAEVTVDCRTESLYFYAMGDMDITCGANGKWKARATGLDAKDLVCFNTLPPVRPVNFATLSHGCTSNSNDPIYAANPFDYSAGVSGTISIWVNTGCAVPVSSADAFYLSRLRTVENGAVKWGFGGDETLAVKITSENRLQAKIALNCGDIRGGIGYDADVSLATVCNTWMHIVFSWDSTVSDSNAEVYVNGVKTGVAIARRVSATCLAVARVSATQQRAAFVMGDENLSTRPHPVPGAQVAAISTFTQRLNATEVTALYYSQRPSCSDNIDACPDLGRHNADIVAVGNVDTRFRLHARMQGGWMQATCRQGFVALTGDPQIECRSSGWRVYGFSEFAATPLVCCRQSAAFCPALSTAGGSETWGALTGVDDPQCTALVKNSRHFGASATRSCAPGYRPQLAGTDGKSSSCSGAASWTTTASQDLVCVKTENYCPLASAGATGVVVATSSEGRRVGSMATLACLEGFEYVTGDLFVSCGSQGIWLRRGTIISSESLTCTRLATYCPVIPASLISVTYSDERRLDSVASTACALGYEAVAGDTQVRCVLGSGGVGRWTRISDLRVDGQMLFCEKVINWCSEPTVSEWTYVSSTTAGLRLDSEARVQCREGFADAITGANSQRIVCRDDRKWYDSASGREAVFLSCTQVPDFCTAVSGAPGLVITQNGRQYGSVVELDCIIGYRTAFGRSQFRCGMGGTYRLAADNAVVPTNYRLKCDVVLNFCPPVEPVKAIIKAFTAQRTLGSEVTMACLPGFVRRMGAERLSCETSGAWGLGEPLECQAVGGFCPSSVPEAFSNAHAELEGVSLGDSAKYACSAVAGEYVMGASEIVCSQDSEVSGTWRDAKTGAPWSLPFVCAFKARQGVKMEAYSNLAYQGEPYARSVVPFFEYENFESAVFHAFIYPTQDLRGCVFSVNGTSGMQGVVNVGDRKSVGPEDFDEYEFTEVSAMMSYRPDSPTETSFGNLLWKCDGDDEAVEVNSEYLIHSLVNIERLARTVTL